MNDKRECPICSKCGSRKFKMLRKHDDSVYLECRVCRVISILN